MAGEGVTFREDISTFKSSLIVFLKHLFFSDIFRNVYVSAREAYS